jgi:hypothetical protein
MPINIFAENYFIDCDAAMKRYEFTPLRDYYNSHPKIWSPDMCFRLNKREYLVTITRVAPILQGLYYYNSTDNTFKLYEDNNTTCFPGISIAEEFYGKNNKRYVLMVGGVTGSIFYKIFNLVDNKDKHSYPFITYEIIGDRWDPVDGLCGNDYPKPTASEILSYRIFNQRTDKVEIVFKIREQDCRTKKIKEYEKKFHIKDGIFTAEQ